MISAAKQEYMRVWRQTPAAKEKARARASIWYHANPEKAKATRKVYRDANRGQSTVINQLWRAANRERARETRRKWREANPEAHRAAQAKYAAAHRAKYAALNRKRQAAKLQRTPPWADLKKIEQMYDSSNLLTVLMGEPYHVDHVFPLQGKKVSGLHVHGNLQILPGAENVRKNNKFEPQ